MIKKLLAGLLVLLAAAQFVRPEKNRSATPGPNDINVRHPVPAGVRAVLARACYNCHSNNTVYPWYAEAQPVGWWLRSHINDAKQHLNFSEFGTYTAKRAGKKLDSLIDEVEQKTMPLKSYTWMHAEARLTPADIKLLTAWAGDLRDEIAPK